MPRSVLFSLCLIGGSLGCSAGGPPFRDAPPGKASALEGAYYFQVPHALHCKVRFGEVFLERSLDGRRNYFYLRVFGISRTGSLRIRSYQGRARRLGDILELRTRRCYIFGKRDWMEKTAPLERWACDHLIFRFQGPDNPKKRTVLRQAPWKPRDRTRFTRWFGRFDLHPMPRPGQAPAHFAGRIVHVYPDGKFIIWGKFADRKLKDGLRLKLLSPAGKHAGEGLVRKRVGDFIFASPPAGGFSRATRGGFATLARRPTAPGIFD